MTWPPKDWRAMAALIGSVGGAAVLTAFVWWLSYVMGDAGRWQPASEGQRVLALRWTLWVAIGTIGLVLIGLGVAINRRTMKGQIGGERGASFEMSGGSDDVPAQATVVAQQATAEALREGADAIEEKQS